MRVSINNVRIVASDIKEYNPGYSEPMKSFFIKLRVRQQYKIIYFDSLRKRNKAIKRMDELFKVVKLD